MPTSPGRLPAKVSLRRLFPEATFVAAEEIACTSATADSRRVQPGQCYVALRGTQCDGHQYLGDAVRRGAAAVLVERAEPALECPQCIVPDTRVAWGRLCQALMGNPADHVSVAGITGTNGKTTTAMLVRQILAQAQHRCGLIGTLEYHDGLRGTAAELTTPDAPVLAHWLQRMVQCGTTHAAMEVSSHALCQHRLSGVSLDVAVITNITGDHVDYHGTYEAYKEAKRRIFEYLAPGGTAVVNLDDPAVAELCGLQGGAPRRRRGITGNVLTFGVEARADVSATLLHCSSAGQRFRLCIGRDCQEVNLGLVGLHNVSNCLAAAAVAHHYGIGLEQIVAGLESVACVPGRLEPVDCGARFQVFVDYAHTDDALRRVLRALRPLVAGRLICVFGAGGDRDRRKRPRMGRVVEAGADVAVVTSDNPRSEDPAAIIAEVVGGFADPQIAHVEPDRRLAIRWALECATQGDAVLIAGKGHENYQLVGGRRLDFDDRQVARQQAAELRGAGPANRRRGELAQHVLETV